MLFLWLFEALVGVGFIGLVVGVLLVKWIVQAGRGIALAFRETRRQRPR